MKFFKLDTEITTEEYKEHMKEVFERIEQDQKVYFKDSKGMSILNKLDELIASVRGSKPDMLLMSRRSWRKIQSLLRAKGDKMTGGREETPAKEHPTLLGNTTQLEDVIQRLEHGFANVFMNYAPERLCPLQKDGTITCKCGKSMHKVTFPDIGLCWACSDPKCREYIVIDDEESG